MKKLSFSLLALLFFKLSIAQNVGIGTNAPHPSALLDLSDASKGLLIPRMTTGQRDAITSPALGLQVFNLDDSSIHIFNGNSWIKATGTEWKKTGNTNTDPAVNFIGTSDAQDVVIRSNNYEGIRLKSITPVMSGIITPVDFLVMTNPGTSFNKWPLSASFRLGSFDVGIDSHTQLDIAPGYGPTAKPDRKIMSLYASGDVTIARDITTGGIGKFGTLLKIGTNVAEGYFQNTQDGAYRSLATGGNQGYFFQNTNGIVTSMYVGLNGLYQGKVGIGTATPQANLEVIGSTKTNTLQIVTGASNGAVLTSDAAGNASWVPQISNSNNIGCVVRSQNWNAAVTDTLGFVISGYVGSANIKETGSFLDTRLYNSGAYISDSSDYFLRNTFKAPADGFYLITLHILNATSNARLLIGASYNNSFPVEIFDFYVPANCATCSDISYTNTIYLHAGDSHRILRSTSGQAISDMLISYRKL